jgi:hypothetical protein
MSAKTEKKERRERKKAIKKYIENNKEMVLEVVIENLKESNFMTRFAFSIDILFKKVVE